MKNVLVIGANGFIGTRLCISLALEGYNVFALVDKSCPYSLLTKKENIKTIEFLLEELDSLSENSLPNDIDTLYHLACIGVNANHRNNVDFQIQNIAFGIKVMEFAKNYGIKRVIMPGSAAEVGYTDGMITGMEKPVPTDMYSATKVATRYVCQTYASQHNIGFIWTLITSIYGPGRNDNNLISYVIKTLLKGEKPSTTRLEQRWDYLYIDDLIKALILIGEKGINGKVYPIGSGENKKMREYVEIIRDLINPALSIGVGDLPYKNPDKIDNQTLDISLLQNDTGFDPDFTFKRGINETINYFKESEQNVI